MGEVCRDMFQGHVDPVPYFKVLQRAIIEFTATFRISGDKIAFLESLLLAIPTRKYSYIVCLYIHVCTYACMYMYVFISS